MDKIRNHNITQNSQSMDKETELALWAKPFERLNKIWVDQQKKKTIVDVLNGSVLQSRMLSGIVLPNGKMQFWHCSTWGRGEPHVCTANSYWHSVMNSCGIHKFRELWRIRGSQEEHPTKNSSCRYCHEGYRNSKWKKKMQRYGWKQE